METVITRLKITDKQSDFLWWQEQSYTDRLAALEVIRREYNQWKYDHQQGFQRFYRVLKQTQG